MNKVAIRILQRVLDALIEQTDDVAYSHKDSPTTKAALKDVSKSLRAAKSRLIDLAELGK